MRRKDRRIITALLVGATPFGLFPGIARGAARPLDGEAVGAADPSGISTPPARGWHDAAGQYLVPPDVATCRAGVIRPDVRADFIARLNALRALHGLAPVALAPEGEREAAEAALVLAANGTIAHELSPDWRCYSRIAARGARTSNLAGGVISRWLDWIDSEDELAGWLREDESNDIGHRRWMLDPFLTRVAYGRVAQLLPDGRRVYAATLKVFGYASDGVTSAPVPAFIAYPYGNYPQRYFEPNDILSFSAVARLDSAGANDTVDFSTARVTVTDGSRNLPVVEQSADNEAYGVANNLSWRVIGLTPGRIYQITVANVRGAPATLYRYAIRIVPDRTVRVTSSEQVEEEP